MSDLPADSSENTNRNSGRSPISSPDDVMSAAMDDVESRSMADIDREVAEAMSAMAPEDLAELRGDVRTGQDIAPGAELVGVVVSVGGDDVFVEFDAKAQGVLPRSQFGKKEAVEVGRRVDVVIERFDAGSGIYIVNRKGALQRATWINLTVGMIVEGRVTGVIKGGLEVNVNGIRAFMPASQADVAPMKDISELLNQNVRCEILEFDRRKKNVLVSRRKLIEKERQEARARFKAELEVGQIHRGVVGTIMEYGAFIDLGGVDGLAHIRDLSWGSVEKVEDVLKPGQEVEVQILKIDRERERISLGLKQIQPDPWVGVEEKYPVGTAEKVRVVRIADFGAFAELETGVEGLIPVSEMGWTRIHRPSDAVSVGDLVDAVVIRLEPEKRRLALSMKQAQSDPWEGVLDSFTAQSLVTGRVTRLADFGAFVELVPGVEGLIHISELADHRVKSCAEVLKVGQDVETRVLGVDKENRRISLSVKAVNEPSDPHATGAPSHEPAKKPKKRKKPLRGGLSSHFDW